VILSLDGVEHFSSTKVHCSSCTTLRHRNGKISYHHSALAAVIVDPRQKEVIPLDFEPILNEDGALKNDCERNAAKRLCQALAGRYSDLKIILLEDALSAQAPHIRQIAGYGWHYILNVKPDSHTISSSNLLVVVRAAKSSNCVTGSRTLLWLGKRSLLVPECCRCGSQPSGL
jgi:hypothetical protein